MMSSPLARRAALILTVALASSAGAAACSRGVRSADSLALNQTVQHGLIGLDGSAVTLPIPGTRATVLHFWSPGCSSCRSTIPALIRKRPEIQATGASLVLVCVLGPGDSPDDARAVLALWGIYEPFVIDRQGAAMNVIGAPSLPAVAILDERGVLTWLAPDGITPSDVVRALP
jgi:hypothetical protein